MSWAAESGFQATLGERTLIARSAPDEAASEIRIAELEEFESRHGAVFFAEKLWLMAKTEDSYAEWIRKNMLSLQEGETLTPEHGGLKGMIPGACLPSVSCPEAFKKFRQPVGNMEYWIWGCGDGESASEEILLTRVFHILFNAGHFAAMIYEGMKSYVDEELLQSLEFWVSGVHVLADNHVGKFWMLGIHDPCHLSLPIFYGSKPCSDCDLWPRFDRAAAEKFLEDNKPFPEGPEALWI